MRLLKRSGNGELSMTDDLVEDDIRRKYAILSHTWIHGEEVTFEEFQKGTGTHKAGYKKIEFCGEQAARDGLEYFWVDTCCIDKSNNTELSKAINSMFRWYRDATRCYVYLSDVSEPVPNTNNSHSPPWETDFRRSRWFRRGWTLQELIAPKVVEFFSKDRVWLGNKRSLEQQIRKITGIPAAALQGGALCQFSVKEKLLWAQGRETTGAEDQAYSLLGIFGVSMAMIYGEGIDEAFRRLHLEIERISKGNQFEDFSVSFSLADVSETEQFVARQTELLEMHKTLQGDGSRRIAVLHGLGGIGKTQLTVAYAKRYRDNYSAVLWLNAKDEDCLKQSFGNVARRILQEHPSAPRLGGVDLKGILDEVVEAVKGWLSVSKNTRWLVIYDNYDNPKLRDDSNPTALDIKRFLPESYQGSIIITTRSSQVTVGRRIPVGKLEDMQDSIEILSNAARRNGLRDDPDAIALVKELDGLPLALATAGSYLDQVAVSLAEYLQLYKASWLKLQKKSPGLSSYEDRKLYSTWNISLGHVRRQNMLSAQLLQLWAYFDNQDLWFELLQHNDLEDPEWIRAVTEDRINFNDAVRVLCDHGLVEADSLSHELESRGYSMHSCVHSWTRHMLNQEWNCNLAKLALKCVGLHIPGTSSDRWWITQRRLLGHAARCSLMETEAYGEMEWALHNLGLLYGDQGKLKEAEEMYMRALQGTEEALGPKHTSTLITVGNYGELYTKQNRLVDADKLIQRALRGLEKLLGPDHLITLGAVNGAGLLYHKQGRLSHAERTYQRALQGYEKAVGSEQAKTYVPALDVVDNLGNLYVEMGEEEKALEMYLNALSGFEVVQGRCKNHFVSFLHKSSLHYQDG
ncbi:HET-domain-containing protein [Eremomyces bilateralis CBS 781.70]|uniref:HET-domain-containing protein n=1 Tax=Eremomyces bilateralis CBS 781.70 TaxID=1392243 RepID=A0A6G1GGJ2_9PEZI|nr:HET-domain-containing protein [Eremomyces bilateralis CBS 781.70]KAF1816980.1 HET-domain-containing protein [Eremomyces bilateralis CBS 781.70]